MDVRVKKAVLAKIQETISSTDEISEIQQMLLRRIPVTSLDDFVFGIAIGRIYNSFHYQTRRALKRNATKEEFAEFLDILAKRADAVKKEIIHDQYRKSALLAYIVKLHFFGFRRQPKDYNYKVYDTACRDGYNVRQSLLQPVSSVTG